MFFVVSALGHDVEIHTLQLGITDKQHYVMLDAVLC